MNNFQACSLLLNRSVIKSDIADTSLYLEPVFEALAKARLQKSLDDYPKRDCFDWLQVTQVTRQ